MPLGPADGPGRSRTGHPRTSTSIATSLATSPTRGWTGPASTGSTARGFGRSTSEGDGFSDFGKALQGWLRRPEGRRWPVLAGPLPRPQEQEQGDGAPVDVGHGRRQDRLVQRLQVGGDLPDRRAEP